MQRMWNKLAILALGLVAWMGVGSGTSLGGLLPTKVTVTQEGDVYRYTYSVVLTSDSTLKSGDYFTIYDFEGYVDDSNEQPSGYSFSTSNTGTTPKGTAPDDDADTTNLTWTYTGDDTDGQAGLGEYVVYSTYGYTTEGTFTSRTHRQVDDKEEGNITETEVPVATSQVPEPGTLALLGLALPLAGLAQWMRRRREVM